MAVKELLRLVGPEWFCFGFTMLGFHSLVTLISLPWTPIVAITMGIIWGPVFLWLAFVYLMYKLDPFTRGIYNRITKE